MLAVIKDGFQLVGRFFLYNKNVRRFLRHVPNREGLSKGAVSAAEAEVLSELATEASALGGPIVEIGTLFGFSTQAIALGMAPGVKLVTVDNFCWNPFGLTEEVHHDLTKRNLHYLIARGQVELVRTEKIPFYANYSGERPAMVFIDARHEYEEVKVDIEWALKMRIPLIVGHDYHDGYPGLKQAVAEAFGDDIEVRETLWIGRPGSGEL